MADNEIEKKEQSSEGLGTGNNPSAAPLIAEAAAAAERMEKATAQLKAENDRREYLLSKDMLGGKSSGAPKEEKEETPQEYARRLLRGTKK